MDKTIFSIIVPVYNAERYLCRCIDSIASQTFTAWELILIDDGSKDNSGNICDQYAFLDKRIKVIHKTNEGVSKARNIGLDIAIGEWITFCDSDDELLPDSLSKYARYFSEEVDVVRGGFLRVSDKGVEEVSLPETITQDKEQILKFCNGMTYDGFLWNSCFRQTCIGDTRFNEKISWCEDHLFTFSVMLNAKTVAILPSLHYCYYVPVVDDYQYGSNLSSRFIEPDMIVAGALQELDVKFRYLNEGSDYRQEVEQNFTYKMHFAVNNSVIAGRFIHAIILTHKYLGNDYRLLLSCIKNKFKHRG